MGTIRETYVLEDKVSSALDNIIAKMTSAVTIVDEMASASTAAADQMASAASQAVVTQEENTRSITEMSDATQDLVDRLSSAERAIKGAFTDSEADAYLASLESQMQKLGLVWTNEADQMEAADLLVRQGLQQLAEQGSLAASVLAEEAYAAQQAAEAEQEHASILQKLVGGLASVASGAASAVSSMLGFRDVKTPLDSLTTKLSKMALSLFTVRKLVSYVTSAMEQAPDEVAESFTNLQTLVSESFSRTVVSAMEAMQSGVEKITAALNSDSGQKFLRGLETAAAAAGTVVGYLADKVSTLIEWMGDNFQTVATAAAGVLAIFAAQMIASAVATIAAKAPLYGMIAAVVGLVAILTHFGVTAEEIFSTVGAAAGWLYALVYNIVADVYNLLATFAEFFENFLNDPVTAIARLFFDLFDGILGMVETAAAAIDALLGSNLSSAVSGFRSKLQSWVDANIGENAITIDRMEHISFADSMAKGASIAASLAESFSDFSLSNAMATAIKDGTEDIADSVSSIEKSVSLSEEDLKSLVDMAERQYVNQINLTAQTPVINITGQNTGNTSADRQALANAIKEILIEQVASGSVRTTARAF